MAASGQLPSPTALRLGLSGAVTLALSVLGCAPSLQPPAGPGAATPQPSPSSAPFTPSGSAGVPDPRGLAIAPDGTMWLTNGASGSTMPAGRVLELGADGTVLAQVDFGVPLGAAVVDASGSLWTTAAGPAAKLVSIQTPSLATRSFTLDAGAAPAVPEGMAMDASGSLWVAEASNSVLLRFKDGAPNLKVAIPATDAAPGAYPVGVAIASNSVWVSCVGSPRVYKRRLTDGADEGYFELPAASTGALGVDKNGLLWAAHMFTGGTKAAAKFSEDPTLKQDYDVDQDVPTALVGDARGYVWAVLHATSRVARITPADGSTLTYQNDAIAHPAAIAVDAQGNAWLASPGATGSIVKIPAAP